MSKLQSIAHSDDTDRFTTAIHKIRHLGWQQHNNKQLPVITDTKTTKQQQDYNELSCYNVIPAQDHQVIYEVSEYVNFSQSIKTDITSEICDCIISVHVYMVEISKVFGFL